MYLVLTSRAAEPIMNLKMLLPIGENPPESLQDTIAGCILQLSRFVQPRNQKRLQSKF
jgi:hypothetical protein